jgi:hypothetical protein
MQSKFDYWVNYFTSLWGYSDQEARNLAFDVINPNAKPWPNSGKSSRPQPQK